jgi:hypothetical protein
MRKVMLVLGLAVTVAGCSWWNNGGSKTVVSDIGQVGSCVLSQLFQGQTNPLSITAACAPATLADVDQIILSLINGLESEGGAGNAALIAQLQQAHAAAQSQMKQGK